MTVRLTIFVAISLLLLVGCKTKNNTASDTTVRLTGSVVNSRTNRGVPAASVGCIEFAGTTHTDSAGRYEMTVATGDSFAGLITLYAFATDYSRDSVYINVRSGHEYEVPGISLTNLSENPDTSNHSGPSGDPATILFVGSDVNSISVRETGSVETARLTYEVRDVRGIPVDVNHRTTVRFSIEGATGGGEYLGNDTAVTTESGRCQVALISGTRPGTIQIMAHVNLATDTLRARPVRMTIHSGPPDSVHTTIGFWNINFPGLDWIARVDSALVLVGDRYSNPVPAGTQVYFNTDHGVTVAQGIVDQYGLASIPFFSGNPYPEATQGWSTVYVQTVDWTGHRYVLPATILWTGVISNLSVTPTTFNLNNAESQRFDITVSDRFNHPLSAGTTLTVTTTAGQLSGQVNLTFPDTWSTGWTHFTFYLSDDDPRTNETKSATITVTVSGRNGTGTATASGIIH